MPFWALIGAIALVAAGMIVASAMGGGREGAGAPASISPSPGGAGKAVVSPSASGAGSSEPKGPS